MTILPESVAAHRKADAADAADAAEREKLKEDFFWMVRARKAFASLGITRLDDLCRTTESQLLSVKNCGPSTVDAIKRQLDKKGLSLKPPTAEERIDRADEAIKKQIQLEEVGKDFVDAMDMAIAYGAIPVARELLDCCTSVIAKNIIDVVSAIESEKYDTQSDLHEPV